LYGAGGSTSTDLRRSVKQFDYLWSRSMRNGRRITTADTDPKRNVAHVLNAAVEEYGADWGRLGSTKTGVVSRRGSSPTCGRAFSQKGNQEERRHLLCGLAQGHRGKLSSVHDRILRYWRRSRSSRAMARVVRGRRGRSTVSRETRSSPSRNAGGSLRVSSTKEPFGPLEQWGRGGKQFGGYLATRVAPLNP